MRLKRIYIAVLLSTALVSAPLAAQDREKAGAGIGGVIGGVLGNVLGKKGDKTVTTLLGVAVGAFIGSRIGKSLNKKDREQLVRNTTETINSGETRDWVGTKKGVSGRSEVVGNDRRPTDVTIPVLKDRITELPPLDFVNANYVAVKKENVRGGPGSDYKQVAVLGKNEVVTVTAKVTDQPWYLISHGGIGTGFVFEKSLKPTTAAPASAVVAGAVEQRQARSSRACRTVKQTVLIDGKQASENITACQTASGEWEIV